jgi:hypothetical protein
MPVNVHLILPLRKDKVKRYRSCNATTDSQRQISEVAETTVLYTTGPKIMSVSIDEV